MPEHQDSPCWIGFDLGGTKMMASVLDSQLRVLSRRRRKTKGNEGAKAGLDRVVETINDAIEESGIARERIAGIGIGVPGLVDLEHGIVVDCANLGWKQVHLRADLAKRFGVPVTVLNDVDAGVYGEYRFGAAKNARTAVGIFPGTGIGGGCVYQGQIIRGKHYSCFEIGHVQVTPQGLPCGCGRVGCLETEASRLAISAAAAAAVFRGEAPNLMAAVGTDLADIRSGVLAQSIAKGDKIIERIVRRAAMFIGRAVGDVVNLLLPDVVILGGGLVEALPELFLEGVTAGAADRVAPAYSKIFKIVISKLGDDAVVRGSAAWCQQQLEKTLEEKV